MACLFAHICVFPLLLVSMVRLAVLEIEELLGILVGNRLDLAQIDLGALCCRSCNMNSFMSEGPYIKYISFSGIPGFDKYPSITQIRHCEFFVSFLFD